jgi:hypothetical protein
MIERNGLYICKITNCKIWYKNGLMHRKDGPAYESDNYDYKEWNINGERHREDGPARVWSEGFGEWWLNGEYFGRKKPENWDELVLKYRAKRLCDL